MMLQFTKISPLILILFVLYGCEYNLTKENYIDLKPPSETQVFNLDLVPTADTIKIFKETTLTYNINTKGLNVLKATMTFQNKTWDFYAASGKLSIDPSTYTPGIDTLTLAIYLDSGTGSIADHSGMEGYYIEKKWTVLLDGRPAPKIIPTKRINEDGLLTIEWPKCEQYNFVAYEIESSSGSRLINKIITNPTHNFYVDSFYVGGDFDIRVSCRVQNDYTWGQALSFHEDPPQPSIKEIGFDSLRISWNKSPYKAKYRLSWANSEPLYFNTEVDTTCTIPQIGFGNWAKFTLCTKSQYEEGWPDLSYACDITSYKEYYMGKRLISANWPEFGYNYLDKVVYSNEYDQMKCIDINTNSVLKSANVNEISYAGLYSCPTNSSKVATITLHDIYIFNDQNLVAPVVINYKSWGSYSIDHFLLTNNDRLAFAYNNMYKLIDINSRQTVDSIHIVDYPVYSKWACISTSQDAKFMSIATNNGIKIYDIGNGAAVESYSDNRNYRSAYFNPYNPNQLYLTLNDQPGIEIRNPSNFGLVDKIDVSSGMVIRNIDPETNNLLITDYKNLFIIDIQTHEILLKIPSDVYKSWLFNNHLFTNTGYALDISDKL